MGEDWCGIWTKDDEKAASAAWKAVAKKLGIKPRKRVFPTPEEEIKLIGRIKESLGEYIKYECWCSKCDKNVRAIVNEFELFAACLICGARVFHKEPKTEIKDSEEYL